MTKGTVLYIGNFELPDKGASANRVIGGRPDDKGHGFVYRQF